MIGIARSILDCMLLQCGSSRLTHKILTTLMADITAVMIARPLVTVSSDLESALILTPAMLLTQKTCTAPPPPGDFGEGGYRDAKEQLYRSMLPQQVQVSLRFDIHRIFSFGLPRNRIHLRKCTTLRAKYVEDSLGQGIAKNHKDMLLLSCLCNNVINVLAANCFRDRLQITLADWWQRRYNGIVSGKKSYKIK